MGAERVVLRALLRYRIDEVDYEPGQCTEVDEATAERLLRWTTQIGSQHFRGFERVTPQQDGSAPVVPMAPVVQVTTTPVRRRKAPGATAPSQG